MMSSSTFYPAPTKEQLESEFVGLSLHDVPVPSAILDLSKVKHSCKQMLNAVQELQVSFRAHVKTHKTKELTRFQVGRDCKDVRLIVSTIIEAETISDLLLEYKEQGAQINLLYGLPLSVSSVPRLAALGKKLGPGAITAMIDNPAQLESVRKFKAEVGHPLCAFIKTDSGYHRAGQLPESSSMINLLNHISDAEQKGDIQLLGFYSHNSLSYQGDSPNEAMDMLKVEIDTCRQASTHLSSLASRTTPLIISVGSSPTALSIQNVQSSSPEQLSSSSAAKALRDTLDLTTSNFELEIHAGVYSVFDLQQVAASSRAFPSVVDANNYIALSVLAEVVSLYPDRTSSPEALINTGVLALAREPCKSYPGWGILSPWNMPESYSEEESASPDSRIIVSRVSQDHGIVGWENANKKDELPLSYGRRVRVWPNHACITSASYGWYLVVDSDGEGKGEKVVEVWPKWRGW